MITSCVEGTGTTLSAQLFFFFFFFFFFFLLLLLLYLKTIVSSV